jgi:hypothetical protein
MYNININFNMSHCEDIKIYTIELIVKVFCRTKAKSKKSSYTLLKLFQKIVL